MGNDDKHDSYGSRHKVNRCGKQNYNSRVIYKSIARSRSLLRYYHIHASGALQGSGFWPSVVIEPYRRWKAALTLWWCSLIFRDTEAQMRRRRVPREKRSRLRRCMVVGVCEVLWGCVDLLSTEPGASKEQPEGVKVDEESIVSIDLGRIAR